MFTKQVSEIQKLRSLDPTDPASWGRVVDTIANVIGNCTHELYHRGPITLDPPNPDRPADAPDIPIDASPDQHYATILINGDGGTVNNTDATIQNGWNFYSPGPNYGGDLYVTNLYFTDGTEPLGKVKVDEADTLDYLEDQFFYTAEYVSGEDIPVYMQNVNISGDNDQLRMFVDSSVLGNYSDTTAQLFGCDSTDLPTWFTPAGYTTDGRTANVDAQVSVTLPVGGAMDMYVDATDLLTAVEAMTAIDFSQSAGVAMTSNVFTVTTDSVDGSGNSLTLEVTGATTYALQLISSGDVIIDCGQTGYITTTTTSGLRITGNVRIGLDANDNVYVGAHASSLVGFFGGTPIVRESFIAAPSGGSTVDAEARTAINAIRDLLIAYNLKASS